MRNWPSTLWPASFRGIAFQVESDRGPGGRRIAIHEFPGSETPFIEDLGKTAPTFQVTAYLASDTVDADAMAFRAALDTPGPGVLVLPIEGPLSAHLRAYDRAYAKDRMGLVAFTLDFVRAGASSPLTSVLMLAQFVYDAVDSLGAAITTAAAQMQAFAQPGWVVSSAIAGLQDIPAVLETVRAEAVIDPVVSAGLQSTLAGIYNAVPTAVSSLTGVDTSVVTDSLAAAAALQTAMDPASAATAFGAAVDDLASLPPPMGTTPSAQTLAANAALAQRLARLTLMTADVSAVASASYASRPDGVAARQLLVARFDVEFADCAGAANIDLYVALQNLLAAALSYLSSVIADLRPLVTASSNSPMPSLWWAWRLYQDPSQAASLVARNSVRHPAWMPMRISALAPSVVAS
ncbi:putative Mu-like prophage DNA circulation protein [Methylocella tundrae]|uniref:Putative Mu-like prophage DNA circulation protein n=1 Tax=Methylocella tundrae TaxID=227605 RepID=A0A8B6MBR7_METTU|nr:DNA circularization N-terminal domain-containing protein [Methylocella tundrae]VTZ52477.1 putative Mu-like prophage DNA circulation protein [Methylocella tundrae]